MILNDALLLENSDVCLKLRYNKFILKSFLVFFSENVTMIFWGSIDCLKYQYGDVLSISKAQFYVYQVNY